MKFEQIKVGQKFKYCSDTYVKIGLKRGIREDSDYFYATHSISAWEGEEVELITKCSNCKHNEIQDEKAYCGYHNMYIERYKLKSYGSFDICEDPETFSCSLFSERGEG